MDADVFEKGGNEISFGSLRFDRVYALELKRVATEVVSVVPAFLF